MENNIELVNYNEADHYEMLCDWWRSWKKRPIERECLPQFGAIAKKGELYIAAAFLVRKENLSCELEYAISNKEAYKMLSKKEKELARDLIVASLCRLGTNLGFKLISCNATKKYNTLEKHFKKLGFVEHKEQTTYLVRSLV